MKELMPTIVRQFRNVFMSTTVLLGLTSFEKLGAS